MENKVRLIEFHKSLCEVLNKAGIRDEWKGEQYDWFINEDDPYTTFIGGICSNERAFEYLRKNGYMDKGICPSCGKSLIDKRYTFRNSYYNPKCIFYICRNCYDDGKKYTTTHLF
jgi:hypothetical protein